MITCMNRIELKFYKELPLHERINDKQLQQEHLAKMIAYDHCDIDGIEIFVKPMRKLLNSLTSMDAVKPY